MSTRSSTTKLVAPFSNPESVIRNCRRNRSEPSLIFDFEEINMDPNNNHGPPPAGPIPQNLAPDLRTMEELCQPTMLGRGGPIAPMTMQATDFGLKNHMIQQVQQSCQYHGLRGDDANKHIDKFLTVTQNMNWEEMVTKFLSKYFPSSMVTKLRNDISNFRQLLDKSLFEAWECYKLSIDRCPNHNMLPITQIDTFYNGLTLRHRDTINVAVGGTFMKRRPGECYDLIENMTAHHNDWDTLAQNGKSSRSVTFSSPEIAALTQQIAEMNKKFLRMCQSNQQVNSVTPSCEACGGPHYYSECQAAANQMTKLEKAFNERPQGSLLSNTVPNPMEEVKVITTRSGTTLAGPSVPPVPPFSSSSKEVERDPETTTDQVHISSPESTARAPSSMFKKLHFNISFAEALAHILKYARILKDLLNNKEKLLKLANTPLNENCSVVLLKKLPGKLGDPGKFLIPSDFNKLEECMALADLVGKFTFPANFIVVDYDVDPCVPLILGRPFLRTDSALVDVHEEELILRVGDEKLTFNVDSTSKYPHKHGNESINMSDIIDTTCDDHFPEVLTVQKSIYPLSGSPTHSSDPIFASLSLSLTPFGDSDLILEETNTFLALDSIPPYIDDGIYDSEGDILFLENLIKDEPSEAEKS
ncbi:reverse transcriptase domain-containing protein [Tanacetum coccineum]